MNAIETVVWMILNVYFEARGEPLRGQMDIVHVVNNRKAIRKLTTVQVITQSYQFSWVNKNAEVQNIMSNQHLVRDLIACTKAVWLASAEIIAGENRGMIDHYFNPKIVKPSWAKRLKMVRTSGNHEFYTSVNDGVIAKL